MPPCYLNYKENIPMAKPFKPSAKPQPVKTTQVRNSPVPKVAAAPAAAPKTTPAKQITQAQIAERAYFISRSGTGGSEQDNWYRAERELRGGAF